MTSLNAAFLSIELQQPGDSDDPLGRYRIAAANGTFSLSTLVWAYSDSFGELAAAIDGFPTSAASEVKFPLGSPGVGEVDLRFGCIDGAGHAVVWVKAISEHPVYPSDAHQEAHICLRVEPAALDALRVQLLALASGVQLTATLHANEP